MASDKFKPVTHNWASCRDFAAVEMFKRARDFGMMWPPALLVRFETAEQAALNAHAAKQAHIEATEEKTKLARHATELEIQAADAINRKANAVEAWTATQPPNTDFTLRRMQAFESAAMVALADVYDEMSVPSITKALRAAWKKTEWAVDEDRSVREHHNGRSGTSCPVSLLPANRMEESVGRLAVTARCSPPITLPGGAIPR